MNGKIKILLICCVFVFHCVCVCGEPSEPIEPEVEDYDEVGEIEEARFFYSDHDLRKVNSTVFKTINKYYCSLDSIIDGSHLMVYGTKGWTFPVQDVNLTLRYPMADNAASIEDEKRDYLITGFKVTLYIDGSGSKGYILDGGVLQDTITLSFVSSNLTTLNYQFWLYGVRKDTPGVVELNAHYRLCT